MPTISPRTNQLVSLPPPIDDGRRAGIVERLSVGPVHYGIADECPWSGHTLRRPRCGTQWRSHGMARRGGRARLCGSGATLPLMTTIITLVRHSFDPSSGCALLEVLFLYARVGTRCVLCSSNLSSGVCTKAIARYLLGCVAFEVVTFSSPRQSDVVREIREYVFDITRKTNFS